MKGSISNKTIVCFFTNLVNDDVKKNFIRVFHFNFVNRFISFHDMISKSGAQYLFVIMNADGNDKKRYTLVEFPRTTS